MVRLAHCMLFQSNRNRQISFKSKYHIDIFWASIFLKSNIFSPIWKHQDINVNICNFENDTPLHKASLASRYVSIILFYHHQWKYNFIFKITNLKYFNFYIWYLKFDFRYLFICLLYLCRYLKTINARLLLAFLCFIFQYWGYMVSNHL
jgi:hypothetical protein